MRSLPTLRLAATLMGCLALVFVAFATLSPIELRPDVAQAGFEHVAAFLVIGTLFGFASPRRLLAVALVLAVVTVSLEAAQFLVPGRHGRLLDLVQKLIGGGTGLAIGRSLEVGLRRLLRSSNV